MRVAIVAVATLTALGALAYAGAQPGSPETSPEELSESVEPEEPESLTGEEDDGFDPAPLGEGSGATEHASRTAIDVLTMIQAWVDGELGFGCEFGQVVSAAARAEEEDGDDHDPCERNGSSGEGASAAGKVKAEEMSAAGKAKGRPAAEAGKAKGAEASAAGKAERGDAPGRGASNGRGGGGSGPTSDPGLPPGAGPGGTPGGP
ncbi:MAG TPA: hypothetical protein VF097_06280 [Actinomycetota bacterium]